MEEITGCTAWRWEMSWRGNEGCYVGRVGWDLLKVIMAEEPENKGGFSNMEAYKQEFIDFLAVLFWTIFWSGGNLWF